MVNTGGIYLFRFSVLDFFRETPGRVITGSEGGSIFNFWGEPQTDCHSGCTDLQSRPRRPGPFPPRPPQHSFFYLFIDDVILTAVRRHIAVVLICFPLMTTDVGHLPLLFGEMWVQVVRPVSNRIVSFGYRVA